MNDELTDRDIARMQREDLIATVPPPANDTIRDWAPPHARKEAKISLERQSKA